MNIEFIEVTLYDGVRYFFNITSLSYVREYGENKIEVCLNDGLKLLVKEHYQSFVNRLNNIGK